MNGWGFRVVETASDAITAKWVVDRNPYYMVKRALRRFVYQLKRRLRGRICPDCGGSGTRVGAIYSNAILLLTCPACGGRGYK